MPKAITRAPLGELEYVSPLADAIMRSSVLFRSLICLRYCLLSSRNDCESLSIFTLSDVCDCARSLF